ncbi:hypothetical protein J0895_15070 [Phormidium pseudopriestleyi FRX01]|uniref:Uncharacterized protein n=1 Tax=Phormidium pseudopriestleyi FRX01 TaxID=1759528 RepID=A0ABS3FTE7_9CYAN|nr:hypothetical protein [Phormidium pseudopriestleyi]MBO0350395.1 hypothetical protein [Phormidium pseudopriestleyi FRX01]
MLPGYEPYPVEIEHSPYPTTTQLQRRLIFNFITKQQPQILSLNRKKMKKLDGLQSVGISSAIAN